MRKSVYHQNKCFSLQSVTIKYFMKHGGKSEWGFAMENLGTNS